MISNINSNHLQALQSTPQHSAPATPAKAQESTSPQVGSDSVSLGGQRESLGEFVPGQVIIKTKPSLLMDDVLSRYGATVLDNLSPKGGMSSESNNSKLLQLQLPEGVSTEEALAKMAEDPSIEYAVPNTIYHLDKQETDAKIVDLPKQDVKGAQGDPNDPSFPKQWDFKNVGQDGGTPGADMNISDAWKVTTGAPNGQGPLIAVIDTGVDFEHPDLAANIYTNTGEIPNNGIDDDGNGYVDDYHGWNAHLQNGDSMDRQGHGTHVAGTIGAVGNNGQGVTGVNWEASILPVKIFSDDGGADAASIIRGINYANDMGARLTSNSWGGGPYNPAVHEAFKEYSSGLHMMSAGNSGTNNDVYAHFPSDYELPNNIAVAATDRNDQLASFSCYGEKNVDIAAPGHEILSTYPNGQYAVLSGTSMATPHVTGAAGLLLAMDPQMSNEELMTRLMEGGDKLESLDGKVASGARLNIGQAMEYDYQGPEKA